MDRKIKVLVFPCGSEIGLEIHNALKYSTHIELYGASSVESNHGKYVFKNYIYNLPMIKDKDFLSELNKVVQKYNIDCIFPAHDEVLTTLSQYRNSIKCKIIAPSVDTCNICRSKRKTYEYLQNYVRTPNIFKKIEDITEFPVFLKPDIGQGSKGIHLCNSVEEVRFYMSNYPNILILEYLPGKEYTVDCFTDTNGQLIFVGARERVRITNGISTNTILNDSEKFKILACKINECLKFFGVWFFQVKEDIHGELCLLEVAPRVSGSMALNRVLGVNLALLSIYLHMNIDVQIIKNNFEIEMDRALVNRYKTSLIYKNVYIDFDDTIYINGHLNILVVAFIYQCINKNVKVHLITKHMQDIYETLTRLKLVSVFDSIIKIDKDDDKTKYISLPNSIFIDDSFSERKKVKEKLGIPTFDVSSLEGLIDWRI